MRVCCAGECCPAGDCFCAYPTFWGYWNADGAEWRFAQEGPSRRMLRDGSVDAWVWGQDGQPPPEPTTTDEVCAGAEAIAVTSSGDEAPQGAPVAGIASFAGLAGLLGAAALVLRRRRTP